MAKTLVATQMPDPYHAIFVQQAKDADFIRLPIGPPYVPAGVEILLSVPFSDPGGRMPSMPPAGWPFDLRWMQLPSVGVDLYPPWFLTGVRVTAGRGHSAVALAEYALAAIFSAAKAIPDIWIERPDQWRRIPIGSIAGSTLGIVGFGGVGQALAPRALAVGMEVLALRRSGRPMAAGVEKTGSIETLFARSDHVVLALPSTRETRHIVNARVLAAAKPGLHLVNVARGALIDEVALVEALDGGGLSRASIDVCDAEPAPHDHPFYRHPRIKLSPHIGTNTADNIVGLAQGFAANLSRFRSGEPLLDLVDPIRR